MEIRVKRVYEAPADGDGLRVLVDRLWPRGLSKEKAKLDLWAKEVAPSSELRKEFHHEGMDFETFRARYDRELDGNAAVEELRSQLAGHDVVTLLYAMNDEKRNHALLLRERLVR